MLDIKFVRENPEIVKENIKKKFKEHKLPLVDEVIAIDIEKRAANTSLHRFFGTYFGAELVFSKKSPRKIRHRIRHPRSEKCHAEKILTAGQSAHKGKRGKSDSRVHNADHNFRNRRIF